MSTTNQNRRFNNAIEYKLQAVVSTCACERCVYPFIFRMAQHERKNVKLANTGLRAYGSIAEHITARHRTVEKILQMPMLVLHAAVIIGCEKRRNTRIVACKLLQLNFCKTQALSSGRFKCKCRRANSETKTKKENRIGNSNVQLYLCLNDVEAVSSHAKARDHEFVQNFFFPHFSTYVRNAIWYYCLQYFCHLFQSTRHANTRVCAHEKKDAENKWKRKKSPNENAFVRAGL